MYISGCTFFYTFALQAIFRLRCTLYQRQVKLHSFRRYVILSISLWILTLFELLPSFLIGDVEYIDYDHHCQFAPTNIRGSITVYSIGFLVPFGLTVFCYIWILFCIREQTAALININQQASIRRNRIILKRLVILLIFMTMVAAPHALIPIAYSIIGYLPLWIVSLEWMSTSLAIVLFSIILVFISPHLKKLRQDCILYIRLRQ